MPLSKNQKRISSLLRKKKKKKSNEENKTERQNTMLVCPTTKYSRNIKQLISNCLFCVFLFIIISVLILKSFPRRCLLNHSFGRLFSPKPLKEVEWRWQKPNDDFKMTDNIIPYYYCLVDCQRTNVLQTSNVINSEPQI